jgi:hypothetical protein
MALQKDDLSRKFLLDVTADGSVFVRERGKDDRYPGSLPVFSTDTRKQANSLIVRYCRRAKDGSGIYRLNDFDGELNSLDAWAETFRTSLAASKTYV